MSNVIPLSLPCLPTRTIQFAIIALLVAFSICLQNSYEIFKRLCYTCIIAQPISLLPSKTAWWKQADQTILYECQVAMVYFGQKAIHCPSSLGQLLNENSLLLNVPEENKQVSVTDTPKYEISLYTGASGTSDLSYIYYKAELFWTLGWFLFCPLFVLESAPLFEVNTARRCSHSLHA